MANIDSFIARWQGAEGGQERANYALFLSELCDVLEVARPEPASAITEVNDYVFERAVTFATPDGAQSHGRIDLYRRGAFVLEAKQSRLKGGPKEIAGQADRFPPDRGRRGRAERSWDILMLNARRQAEDYAKALPADHGWPPFIIVCDVGRCLELYADFSGQGKNYAQFPDRRSFRIFLEDLRQETVRARLKAVWQAPHSLDPARRAAKATRAIAERLAAVSKLLEARGEDAEEVALFLMRCIFTMFAEDTGLLPESAFKQLLEDCEGNPALFPQLISSLWQAMDEGEVAPVIRAKVRRFNGYLFKSRRVLPLNRAEIAELRQAAAHDWTEVDPSIFGTLLEQALDPETRARLGAHYTPRRFVERLIIAAIIEPLRADWRLAQAAAERQKGEGDRAGAISTVKAFQARLVATRVLDPACGTGNFLYVALELMKRLEGEALEALLDLGGEEALKGLERHEVDPHQFLGLEINERARHIAELVLWIGYLQWHLRTHGALPGDPVLKDYKTIEHRDAVLAHDGVGVKEGKEVLLNPRRPDWPAAEFIVGNPPFIGGKDIRSRTSDAYAQALWAAHPQMNEAADFVMYWWDRAAELLTRKDTILRRFGLVTTNSITQVFQRRVVERHLKVKAPISLVMAIPDHPWTKATRDAAAVRIAMTVVEAGAQEGILREVTREAGLETDEPAIDLKETRGVINADLTVGVDVTQAAALKANDGLCSPGVKLHGSGFIVTPQEAAHLGLGRRAGLERHVRAYRNGRDLTATPRGVLVIDLFGLDQDEVRKRYPEVYQHLLQTVKPERDANNRETYKQLWWIFGEPRKDLRPALDGLPRYIATVETAKHRVFQFLDAEIMPDNMLVCIASDDAFHLGVLSSRAHVAWTLLQGGTLEDRPRYTKSHCFDPFPFPDPDPAMRAEIAAIAEDIDAHRKARQQEHPGLTLTQMYNVLERLKAPVSSPVPGEDGVRSTPGEGRLTLRSSPPETQTPLTWRSAPSSPGDGRGEAGLTPDEARILEQGLVLILKELHDKLDAAVLGAYGWPASASEQDILARLVALNAARSGEEGRGHVRWLRPVYQIARFGTVERKEEQIEAELVQPAAAARAKRPFPTEATAQTAAVMMVLMDARAALTAGDIAGKFRQGLKVERQVAGTLAALARFGDVASPDGGRRFALRRTA